MSKPDPLSRFIRPTSPPAFTLIELLVVIGIIALLIAILLPTLNGARDQGNSIKCQANLRTIGQAITLYTNSHKGSLPYGFVTRNDVLPGTIVPYDGETSDW